MIDAALAFAFGLLIGSFLNVCIYRLTRGLSIVRPRSYCPNCGATISWYDNIPVLSYALLRGKCRRCKHGIPVRYPIVELAAGLLFGYAVYRFGVGLFALRLSVLGALLIALVASDLEEKLLPDALTITGLLAGFFFAYLDPMTPLFPYFGSSSPALLSLTEALFGAAVPSFLIWAVGEIFYRVRGREGLGLGDVKMLAMIGAFLGIKGALATLFMGSLIGAVIGLVYVRIARKDAATYEIPFGVFLGLAALAVALAGSALFDWYFGLGA